MTPKTFFGMKRGLLIRWTDYVLANWPIEGIVSTIYCDKSGSYIVKGLEK
jgi:hypothetical protein